MGTLCKLETTTVPTTKYPRGTAWTGVQRPIKLDDQRHVLQVSGSSPNYLGKDNRPKVREQISDWTWCPSAVVSVLQPTAKCGGRRDDPAQASEMRLTPDPPHRRSTLGQNWVSRKLFLLLPKSKGALRTPTHRPGRTAQAHRPTRRNFYFSSPQPESDVAARGVPLTAPPTQWDAGAANRALQAF